MKFFPNSKNDYYVNPLGLSPHDPVPPQMVIDKEDENVIYKVRSFAKTSLSFEFMSIIFFITGLCFFIGQSGVSYNSYDNQINNGAIPASFFWPLIVGGCLYGMAIICKIIKIILQMMLVPKTRLLNKYADLNHSSPYVRRYMSWGTNLVAVWASFNSIVGIILDLWIIKLTKKLINLIKNPLSETELNQYYEDFANRQILEKDNYKAYWDVYEKKLSEKQASEDKKLDADDPKKISDTNLDEKPKP